MRLTIIDKDDQGCTLVEIIALEWDGKSNDFTTFCADGDYVKIRLASPLLVKSVVNELKTLGNAEIEGAIAWNGANFDESDENRENEKSDCDTMTVDQVKHSVESPGMDYAELSELLAYICLASLIIVAFSSLLMLFD